MKSLKKNLDLKGSTVRKQVLIATRLGSKPNTSGMATLILERLPQSSLKHQPIQFEQLLKVQYAGN